MSEEEMKMIMRLKEDNDKDHKLICVVCDNNGLVEVTQRLIKSREKLIQTISDSNMKNLGEKP